MFRLYLLLGTDRKNLKDWVMVAQLNATDILDKRNRLINQGHLARNLQIVRLRDRADNKSI